MTAQFTEFPGNETEEPGAPGPHVPVPGPRGSHRRTLLIVGLVLTALLVIGAVFLFQPFADAAGGCGGG